MQSTFLQQDWASLSWSPWVPFAEAANQSKTITKEPGLYRIKPIGIDKLAYIGQTGRDLRERVVHGLVKNTLRPDMPYNDPHTAAPSLWALTDANGWGFEFSVAAIDLPDHLRKGLECYLLWQYRLEAGESTLCNHGRFHGDYEKSSDRSKGRQGGRLPEDAPRNPGAGPSWPPLPLIGQPSDSQYMGLFWSLAAPLTSAEVRQVPHTAGIYKLLCGDTGEVLYFGQSQKLRTRIRNHIPKDWGVPSVLFSYVSVAQAYAFQLQEIENDVIAAYYALTRDTPRGQFQNKK